MSEEKLETKKDETEKAEYRAVSRVGGASLTIVLPRHFSKDLEVDRGNYVKIIKDGKRLIIQKADEY